MGRTAPDGMRASEWSYQYNSAGELIVGDFKLIVGVNPNAVWTSLTSPNNTVKPEDWNGWSSVEVDCGDATHITGCLFNIKRDPWERRNLAGSPQHSGILAKLQRRYAEIAETVYDPDRGDPTNEQVCDAYNSLGDFVGPYLP